MKKFNLSKELLLNGVLIGALSIGLVSCGGGGGGGSVSSTPTSPIGSCPSTPTSYSLATYLCSGGYASEGFNLPIITVYIDGQPVELLADTGESGLVVNSSAVNIPSSDIYNSYTFPALGIGAPGISGVMAKATVCLNPSITNTCVVMPIGLVTSNSDDPFTTNGEPQGDFGLASGLNSLDIGINYSSGSSITGYSYPYYLEQQSGSINSYTISFYPLSNTFYANVPLLNTPIGQISFGVYNGNSNTLIPYTMNTSSLPSTTVVFPSSNSSTPSFTSYATFDTGYRYNFLSTEALQTEIPNFSQSSDEGACANYDEFLSYSAIVNGGFPITYVLRNSSGRFQTESFTTEPTLSFCEADIPFTLMEGVTIGYPGNFEIFGLPAMLGHTFTWVLATSGTNQGLVQDIGISP